MELTHSFTVPAGLDEAWATFMDIEGVAECFPGAAVTEATADSFSGTVKVKLGPIALTYAGSGRFVERDDAAHRAVIEAKGKDKRGNGTAGATATIALADAGEGSTRADVTTDLTITGKPAQFGRGVMQDVSDKLLGQFVACVEGRMTAGATAPEASPEEAPEPSPEPVPEAGPVPAPPEAAAAPGPPPAPGGASPAPRPEPEALDLGAAVLPVLLRSYGPALAAGLVGLALGILLGRSSRRR